MPAITTQSYFISLRLAKEHPWKAFKSITAKRATGRMLHRKISPRGPLLKGFVLSGKQQTLERYIKKHGLIAEHLIETKGGFCGVLYPKRAHNNTVTITDNADRIARTPNVDTEIKMVLGTIAKASGLRFNVLVDQGPAIPPFPKEDGVVNVVIGAAPPGAIDEAYDDVLCGVRLDQKGHFVYRRIATNGRGVILRDEQDKTFAQLVDTTLYLLVPVTKFEAFALLDSVSGPGLFQKVFVPAWDAYMSPEKHRAVKPRRIISSDIYDKEMQISFGLRTIAGEEAIKKQERHVTDRLEKYLEALGQLATLSDLMIGIDKREKEIFSRLKADWERLSSHPLIESIEKVGEAVHFKTSMLSMEYQDKRYRLGAYTIRYSPGNMVSVWAHEYVHPKRIDHPHISPGGIVCFGNVSQNVYESAMRMDMVEMVETILRWLTEGYVPHLADTKIEEWPMEKGNAKLQPPR